MHIQKLKEARKEYPLKEVDVPRANGPNPIRAADSSVAGICAGKMLK